MSTLALQDTLAGASAGNLAGRVSTSGHTWANSTGTNPAPDNPCHIDSTPSIISSVNVGSSIGVSGWTPPGTDYGFAAVVKVHSATQAQTGPAVRFASPGGGNIGYLLAADATVPGYVLYKITNASLAALATAAHTFAVDEVRCLYLKATNDGTGGVNLTAYVDGTQVLTYHDTTGAYTSAGQAAVRVANGDLATSSSILSVQTDPQASTLTGPTSGTVGVASTNFTLTLEVPAILASSGTPSDSSGGGTFAPTSLSYAAASGSTPGVSSATFTYAAGSTGAKSISAVTSPTTTVSGSPITYTAGNPAATSYTLTGPTGGIVNQASTNYTVALNGNPTGTQTITITPSGGGLSTPIVLTFTGTTQSQTFAITPSATGTVTLTPSSSPQLGTDPSALHYAVTSAPTTWTYRSSVEGFATGLATVGYRVIAHDNSVYKARTTAGVSEIAAGTGIYAADVTLPFSGSYHLLWDDGNAPAAYASETISPLVVETTGQNLAQAMSIILAAVAGRSSGNQATGTSSPQFLGADGSTTRLAGTTDQLGNRSAVTLTPPS